MTNACTPLLVPLVVLLLAVAPVRAEAPAGAAPPEVAVMAADRALAAAVAAGDREAFAALLAEDALFLGGGVLRGRRAVVAGWAPFFEEGGPRLAWEPTEAEAAGSGDLAYTVGDFTLTSRGENGSDSVTSGRYLTAWAREGDGPWRVVADGSLVEDGEPVTAATRARRADAGPGAALGVSWRPERTVRAASGELALDLGSYRVEAGGPADGEAPGADAGAYITVWRRDGDGGWTVAAESASPPGRPDS